MRVGYSVVWNAARIIQMSMGLCIGLSFIYGLFFYERLGGAQDPAVIHATLILFVLGYTFELLLDVPTGVLADRYGRRYALIASFVCFSGYFFFLAVMCFVSSKNSIFALACLAVSFSSIGSALFSGSLLAWIVDTHQLEKVELAPSVIISKSTNYYFIGKLVGTVITLMMYMAGLTFYAFAIGFIMMVIASLYCTIVMEETRGLHFESKISFRKGFANLGKNTKDAIIVFRNYPQIFFVSLIMAMFMFINGLVGYLWPIALKTNFGFDKMSGWWFFIVIAAIALAYISSQILSKWIRSHFDNSVGDVQIEKLRHWLVVGSVTSAVPILVLGTMTSLGSVNLILLAASVLGTACGYGFIRPCYQILVNRYIPKSLSQQRATILSLGNTMVSVITMVLAVPSGGSSGSATVLGWMIPAALLVMIALIGNFVMRRAERLAKLELIPLQPEIENG